MVRPGPWHRGWKTCAWWWATPTWGIPGASAGDKVTYVTSKAIIKAGQTYGATENACAGILEASPQDIMYDRKRFWVQGSPERGMT